MPDYRSYSFWLETAGDDLTPRPRLDGDVSVDIAILGAGYSGLWTAYYLLQRDPSLKIAIVEKEIAGFGASGRNGGWCSAGFPVSLGMLRQQHGDAKARDLVLAMNETVVEVGRVAAAEGIDIQYERGGTLRLARGPHQVPSLLKSIDTARAVGLPDQYTFLDREQLEQRIRVAGAEAAVATPHCASIHPGRLVRGLARTVERLGATIYEQTPAYGYAPGTSPRIITPYGDVSARTVVLAGEAYLSQLPQLKRALLPIYSLIVLSHPLSPAQWAQIGWENRECVSSTRYTVDYLNRTADGRILFGGRGAPYLMHSKISDEQDRHEPTHEMLRRNALTWFPVLREVGFSHAWGGPLGAPRDWTPTFAYDRRSGIATARGYTGQGVATANLAGRLLTDLITEQQSALTELPIVNHHSPDWEPEPLRWAGIRFVQRGYQRIDDKAERTGVAPTGKSLAERLGNH